MICRIILMICVQFLFSDILLAASGFNTRKTCVKPGMFTFTFDDGVTKNYPKLLEVLDKEGIKATLFIEGQVASDRARFPLLKEAYRRGHTIANHSWTHPRLVQMTRAEVDAEIKKTEDVIGSAVGYVRANKYMRPPHGEVSDALCSYLTIEGFKIVLWNIELTGDWRKGRRERSSEQLWNSFMKLFKNADPAKDSFILLQHDKSLASIELIPEVVKEVKSKGFRIVSLDECLGG